MKVEPKGGVWANVTTTKSPETHQFSCETFNSYWRFPYPALLDEQCNMEHAGAGPECHAIYQTAENDDTLAWARNNIAGMISEAAKNGWSGLRLPSSMPVRIAGKATTSVFFGFQTNKHEHGMLDWLYLSVSRS